MVDLVNKPPHYELMEGVEVYDVRGAILDKIEDSDASEVLLGNVLMPTFSEADDWSRAWEYLTRMWGKNGLEDAKKCRWYLNKLIEKLERRDDA